MERAVRRNRTTPATGRIRTAAIASGVVVVIGVVSYYAYLSRPESAANERARAIISALDGQIACVHRLNEETPLWSSDADLKFVVDNTRIMESISELAPQGDHVNSELLDEMEEKVLLLHKTGTARARLLKAANRTKSALGVGDADHEQEPDLVRMRAAIAEAKSSFGRFTAALAAGESPAESFTVKKAYPCPDGGDEFVWITHVTAVADDAFEGVVDETPEKTKDVKRGQRVRVQRDEIVDWMYLDIGRMRGAYTIAAAVYGTPEQLEYENLMAIDWDDYEFLKEEE